MDRILLHGIQFYGYHGVYEEERRLGQRFLVDVEMGLDLRGVEARDDIADAVDYSQVHALVLEMGAGEPCRLLETLASRIAAAILARHSVRQVTVRVTKPAPPMPGVLAGVTVEITRP